MASWYFGGKKVGREDKKFCSDGCPVTDNRQTETTDFIVALSVQVMHFF
jgi:hypothetical protein